MNPTRPPPWRRRPRLHGPMQSPPHARGRPACAAPGAPRGLPPRGRQTRNGTARGDPARGDPSKVGDACGTATRRFPVRGDPGHGGTPRGDPPLPRPMADPGPFVAGPPRRNCGPPAIDQPWSAGNPCAFADPHRRSRGHPREGAEPASRRACPALLRSGPALRFASLIQKT